VHISRAVAANALWNLTAGRWPAAPDTQRTTSAVLIHPRVSLAPLLAASSPVCVGAARGLLTRKAPNLMAEYLDDIWWPSTTAMAVLGTNRVPFKKLVQAGHLTPREDGRHSAAAINELLWRIKGCREGDVPMKPLSAHRVGSNPESLASLITKIKAGVIAFYYFPVETGLDGLLCESVVRPPPVTAIFGLKEVARRLGTNTESIRCAIQLGWLDGSKGTPRSAVEWSISSASLRAFNATYVFASAVAREHQVSALTIASRLRSAGLVAVSGPDVDGGVTYVFERSHMSHVDLASVLKGPYRSPAGRKTNSVRAERGGTLTSQESAAILGISVRQLRDVTHAGWIAPVAMVQRRRVFEGKAVRELKRSLEEDFVSLPAAASTMDQSIAEFRRTWVYTQTISAHRFANRTLVRSEDLGRIQDIWQDSGTSTSIGRTLNRQRWLCPNLQTMEQMPSPTIIGTGSSKVRLYLRGAQMLAKCDMT
ncbi:MAG: hypothetical protein QE272_04580, partial [Nevskia sp.]|nr:hypothetical protein [Nevskia sp.]